MSYTVTRAAMAPMPEWADAGAPASAAVANASPAPAPVAAVAVQVAPAAASGTVTLMAADTTHAAVFIPSGNLVAAPDSVSATAHVETASAGLSGPAMLPVVAASASGTDASPAVGLATSFALPFTHEVASGSDVTYVTQDDGSIVVSDAETGLPTDWTIIV